MDEVHGGGMFWCKSNSRFRSMQTRILGSYLLFFIFKGGWGQSPHSFPVSWTVKRIRNCPGSEFEMILAHRMDDICGKGKA